MRVLRGVVLAVTAASLLAGCTLSVSEPRATPSTSTDRTSPTQMASPATPSVTAPGTVTPDATTAAAFIFLGNSILNRDADCSLTFPVPRRTADAVALTEAAVEELLAGPTPAEQANGYTSWFSKATADGLISIRLAGDTAYVNLANHAGRINNASTSCGSAGYLSQLDNTVRTASGATRVLYAFDGDPEAFWYWLQIACTAENDNCDPAPFAGP